MYKYHTENVRSPRTKRLYSINKYHGGTKNDRSPRTRRSSPINKYRKGTKSVRPSRTIQYGGGKQINIFSHNILSNEFVSHITGRHENFINQNRRYNKILDCMEINAQDNGENNIYLLQEVEPYFLRLLQKRNKDLRYVFSNKCFTEALENMGFVGEYNLDCDAIDGTNCAIIWNKKYFTDESDDKLKAMYNTICNKDRDVYGRKSSAIVSLKHNLTGKKFIFASFHRAGASRETKKDIIEDVVSYFDEPIYEGYIKILGGDANSSKLPRKALEKYNLFPHNFFYNVHLTTLSHDYHSERLPDVIDYILINKEADVIIKDNNTDFEGNQYQYCGNEIDIHTILEKVEPKKRNDNLYKLAVPKNISVKAECVAANRSDPVCKEAEEIKASMKRHLALGKTARQCKAGVIRECTEKAILTEDECIEATETALAGSPRGYGSDHFPISISILVPEERK